MQRIKAIETDYDGHRFRSRLEARWAVFFNALRVDYEYEPEGFDLGDGIRYLPDFKVKCWGKRGTIEDKPFDLYIEVKGEMTPKDSEKILRFSSFKEDTPQNPVLIVGNIPALGCSHDSYELKAYDAEDEIRVYPYNYYTIDGDYFAAYPAAHCGRFYLWGDDSNYINVEDVDAVEKAYDLARKARFEHGEKPVI